MARTKMTRHELKEQDEITTSLQRFTDFAVARQKELIIGGSAVLVIVLASLGTPVSSPVGSRGRARTMLTAYTATTNKKRSAFWASRDPIAAVELEDPAGLEKFFEEAFYPVEDRSEAMPPMTGEFMARVLAAAPKCGMEFVPPASR